MSLLMLTVALALAEAPTCPAGQAWMDGARCCWPGQSWVEAEGRCGGAPKACPEGLEPFDIGCFQLEPSAGLAPQGPRDLRFGVGVPVITGPRKAPEALDAIGAVSAPLRLCHVTQLAVDPSVRGSVSAAISLKASGRVAGVTLSESTLGSPAMEACARGALQALRLSPAEQPSEVRVRLLFTTRAEVEPDAPR